MGFFGTEEQIVIEKDRGKRLECGNILFFCMGDGYMSASLWSLTELQIF